jgi:hypothetical protein
MNTGYTTTNDLIRLATILKLPLIVGMRNELPDRVPKSLNMILNLQSTLEGNGTHWVSLVVRDDTLWYFDTYGIAPPIEVVQWFITAPRRRIVYNYRYEIQRIIDGFCGEYSLFFIKKMNSNPSMIKYRHYLDEYEDVLKSTKPELKIISS